MNRRALLAAVPLLAAMPARVLASAPEIWDRQYDVVVLGSGGAGLAAALSAAARGLTVAVFEKNARIGGDTLNSSGFFNAAGLSGTKDKPIDHAREMIELGEGLNDPELVRIFTENCPGTFKWLQSLGMQFEDKPYKIYGTKEFRSYRPNRPRGTGYIHALGEASLSFTSLAHISEMTAETLGDTELLNVRTSGIGLLSSNCSTTSVGESPRYGRRPHNISKRIMPRL